MVCPQVYLYVLDRLADSGYYIMNLIIHTGCMVSSRERFKFSRGPEPSRKGIWIRLLHYALADIYERTISELLTAWMRSSLVYTTA